MFRELFILWQQVRITAVMLFVFICPLITHTDSKKILYVSQMGNGNLCTQEEPCNSFDIAQSLASPGTIIQMEGTFPSIEITKSDLTVRGGTYDGSFPNAKSRCVQIRANNVVVDGVKVINCESHAIISYASNSVIKNSTVSDSVLENQNGTGEGWGSCIKGELGAENLIIVDNRVERCWGEAIGITMTKGAIVKGNVIYNAWAAGIYVDNSFDVLVDGNLIACFDPIYKRGDIYPFAIAMSNEDYVNDFGWEGAQLNNITLTNNLLTGCQGIAYWVDLNAGIKNILIAHNSMWETFSSVYIESGPGETEIVVKNNIIAGDEIEVPAITKQSNNILANTDMFKMTPKLSPQTWKLRTIFFVPSIGVLSDFFCANCRNNTFTSVGAIEFERPFSLPYPE